MGPIVQAEEYRRRYLADQVETATPAQRLIMLFDRLCQDLDRSLEAFAERDIEAINNHLQHAQQILFALRDPLDRQSEIGRSLGGLYDFFVAQLIDANLRKRPTELPAIREMIASIAAANRTIAKEIATGADEMLKDAV